MLADRVGIIDHGPHRRRGHAGGAEGRDRPPHGRGRARRSAPTATRSRERAGALRRARRAAPTARWPCGCAAASRARRRRARARRRGHRASRTCSCTQPTLDDVFLAKTGPLARGRRRRRGRASRRGEPRERRRREASPLPRRSARSRGARCCARCASRRSSSCRCLPDDPARGQRRRAGAARRRSRASRPTRYLDFALAVPFMQGALFAVDQRRHQPRARHRVRLLRPPRADAAARAGAARRAARGRARRSALVQALVLPGRGPRRRAPHSQPGLAGVLVLLALSMLITLGFGALGAVRRRCAPARARRCRASSRCSSCFLFLSSMRAAAQPDPGPTGSTTVATYNPVSYLIEGIRSPDDHRLGRRGARARLRLRARRSP